MRRARAAEIVLLAILAAPLAALAQSCPEPLASAKRLVLVTADTMTVRNATLRRFERDAAVMPWRPVGGPVSAVIGTNGMAWSFAFRGLAQPGEPVKVDGDKRIPAGVYRLGPGFGFAASSRAGYRQIRNGTVCVDDPRSAAYNTITSRAKIGWKVHGENMWRIPDYRNGLMVDYPTDAKARGGSCIFIHVRLPKKTSTNGCVALPEPQVVALQSFAEPGAVLAVLPREAVGRLKECLRPL